MQILKQSTAIEVKIGPFVDATDGVTAESGLTITSAEVLLAKNAGDWTAKTEATSLVHESNGWYRCLLDTTDTGTLGMMGLQVAEAGAVPVWDWFWIVTANIYDTLFSTDVFDTSVTQIAGAAVSTSTAQLGVNMVSGATDAITAAVIAANAIGASELADGAIDAATFAADTNVYQAKVWLIDDDGGTSDRYAVVWHKNGAPVVAGITSPTIQVIRIADATDLIGSTAMTQIGATGLYRYVEATNRVVNGVGYIAKVQATIDSATRTWYQPCGRDST